MGVMDIRRVLSARGFWLTVAFTVVLWLLALVLWSANDLAYSPHISDPLKRLLAQTFVIGVAFSALLAAIITWSRHMGAVVAVSVATASALAMGLAHGIIDAFLVRDLLIAIGRRQNMPILSLFIAGLMPFVFIYLFYAAVLGLMMSSHAGRQRERQLAEAQAAAQQAQLAALRFQLNPHFLFNTLNAISSLIVTGRNDDAERMTVRLSAFLRSSLEADPLRQVPLDEEFATVQSYLDIEAARFGERLQFEFSCPVPLLDALVPSFLLQPVIENAVKYAVAPSRRTVTIAVRAVAEGGMLHVHISDNGEHAIGGKPMGGTGVGLANVRRRLTAFYGEAGTVEAVASGRGFSVRIALPLHRMSYREAAE
ncbi:MAG: histidine kinase [Sphingobium sp.]